MKSKNYKGPERRAYLRLGADYAVEYVKLSKDLHPKGNIVEDARSGDISGAGIKILATEHISVGSLLETYIKMPTAAKFITAVCRVVRCEPDKKGRFEIALAFAWIAERDREAIDRYVKKIKLNMLRSETKM